MSKKKLPNFKIAGALEYKDRPIKAQYLYAEEKWEVRHYQDHRLDSAAGYVPACAQQVSHLL